MRASPISASSRGFRRIAATAGVAGACVVGVAAALPGVAAASPGWVTPQATLNPSALGTTTSPLVRTNAKGDTVIVWQPNGSGPIYESERPAGGSFTSGAPVVLMSGGTDQNMAGASLGSLALDNSGTIYLFFNSSGGGPSIQSDVAVKAIGGSSWTVTNLQKGNSGGFIPTVPIYGAVAPNGAAVAIWESDDLNDFLASVFNYALKPAGSSTWSTPAAMPGTTGGGTFVRAAIDSSGDAAALLGFVGGANYYGAELTGGGGWTNASQISQASGSGTATNGSVAISSTGLATAIWDMTNGSASAPVAEFSTKTLAASTWPEASSYGGANDLAPTGMFPTPPSIAIAPDGTTTIGIANVTTGAITAETRAGTGGAFAASSLTSTLTSPLGVAVAAGGDGSTTVLWSGMSNSASKIDAAYRPSGGSFAAAPSAPGTSDSNPAAAADGAGDVSAAWSDQVSGNFNVEASGLVTSPPVISDVNFPSTAKAGTPFAYGATVTPDQWTTIASDGWSFGDGTSGPLTGDKTYSSAGNFAAKLTATDPFGNTASQSVSIAVSGTGPGGPVAPGKPTLTSKVNKKTRTATFTFTDKGATSFSCALVFSGGKTAHSTAPKPHYASCASPKKYKKLRHGKYRFFVKGRNSAGASPAATKAFSV